MKTYPTTIREISPAGTEQVITLAALPSIQVTPGQYFRAFAPSSAQVIPIPVYPFAEFPDQFLLCGKLPVDWHPGMDVLMQGPFGNSFSLSLSSRRLLLCAAHLSLEPRLFLLALHALQRAADVVWVSDSLSLALPPQIEILKRSDLPAAMEWSDACAVAVPLHQAGETLNALHIKPADRSKVEVFIDAPLVCGSSRCGVCALETRKGFRLACKDGPIFPLKELQGD